MKKIKIHLLLLLFISSASQAQKDRGLPVWPLVTASPEFLQKVITNYTPHEVVDFRATPPSWTTVPGTAPTEGSDNWAQSQAGFDDCGNMVFYVLHTGRNSDRNAAELYRPDGTLLLGKSTTPSAPNANSTDGEMQVVKRPGYTNQWFIIYSKQWDDGYYFVNVLYSLIEIEGNVATYVTLNNVLQKDITLEAPALEASPNCNNTNPVPRIYLTGKAVSRTSKTIGNSGHDLYLYRVFERSKPIKIPGSNNKHIKNTTFSVDRFEISANGIQWSANSGPVEGYIWQLMSPSTTMELSPDEKKLCVVPTSDYDDITKIFIFNLDNGSGSCSQYLNNFPKVLKVSDLLVVPDENNSDFVDYKYIKDKGTISSASEFPLPSVKRGWTYKITNASGVTDNNSSKTNTGLSFNDNDEIT